MKTSIAVSNEMVGPAGTRLLMLRKGLLVCGILASLVWLGADILAALRYEGYNYPFQVISDLSALGAPTRQFVSRFFNVFLVLKFAFAAGIWMSAGQNRSLRITAGLFFASGANDIATSFFPLNNAEAVLGTFNNIMHAILAGGAAVVLILLTIGFGARAAGRWFRFYSYGTLLVMIVSGGVMAFLDNPRIEAIKPPPWFGVTERINGYGFMLWMVALAIVLLRTQPESLRGEPSNARDDYQR